MSSPPTRRKRQGVPYDRRRITRKRVEAGLSQADLAELADLSTSQISSIETGAHGPSAASLGRIADALGCEVKDLLRRERP